MNLSCRILAVVLISFFVVPKTSFAKDGPQKPFTVVIDPGHGGKDPGAVYKQYKEKDIVLDVGLKLGNYLKKNLSGVNVIYTRSTDKFIPLYQRANIANKNEADLFISLHANYCGTPSVYGTETFVLGLHKNEANREVAAKENAAILFEEDYTAHYEGFDNTAESEIMFTYMQDEYLEQSIGFADDVQTQFRSRAGRKDRSVKQAGFLVLWRTSMPSVLVEVGFLSNPAEARYMASEKGQAILASAIFRAVREYKNRIEAKSNYKIVVSNDPVNTENIEVEKPIQTRDTGIYFGVQLAVSSKKIEATSKNFNGLAPISRIKAGNAYKYVLGKEYSFEAIQQVKNKAKAKYPDAFIIAFDKGKQIPVKKALKKIKR